MKNPEQIAASVKEQYTAAQQIQITADITADLGEQTMTYRIGYEYERDGQDERAVMTVLAPESIEGIRAEITGQDFRFQYDDTELETAMPDRKGLTPVDVTTYLLYDLMHAVPQEVWTEGKQLALRFEQHMEECAVVKEVWIHPQTGSLTQARIYCNGKQRLQCVFDTCTLR